MLLAGKYLLLINCFFLLFVSLYSPFIHQDIYQRWFSQPNIYYLAPLPICTGLLILRAFYYLTVNTTKDARPFNCCIGIFCLSFIGIVISTYPYIVPRRLTIFEALAPDSSLKFMFWGVAVCLPVLIIYTQYAYSVFSGKTRNINEYVTKETKCKKTIPLLWLFLVYFLSVACFFTTCLVLKYFFNLFIG